MRIWCFQEARLFPDVIFPKPKLKGTTSSARRRCPSAEYDRLWRRTVSGRETLTVQHQIQNKTCIQNFKWNILQVIQNAIHSIICLFLLFYFIRGTDALSSCFLQDVFCGSTTWTCDFCQEYEYWRECNPVFTDAVLHIIHYNMVKWVISGFVVSFGARSGSLNRRK